MLTPRGRGREHCLSEPKTKMQTPNSVPPKPFLTILGSLQPPICFKISKNILLLLLLLYCGCPQQASFFNSPDRITLLTVIKTLIISVNNLCSRLEKRGPPLNQELSKEGAVREALPAGTVVGSLSSPRKTSWIIPQY